jgi:outer membrane protein TolC
MNIERKILFRNSPARMRAAIARRPFLLRCLVAMIVWGAIVVIFSGCMSFFAVPDDAKYKPRLISPSPSMSDAVAEGDEAHAPAAFSGITPEVPVNVSIEEAVLLAMENNRNLVMQRLAPEVARTFEEEAQSVFDPVLSASITEGRSRVEEDDGAEKRLQTTDVLAGLSQFFPTGTDIHAELSTGRNDTSSYPRYETRAGITATQALLAGRGIEPNLALLRQARIDTLVSEYELQGFAEDLVARVEITYWEYVLARRQVEIYQGSLELAEQQLAETRHRIRVGGLAETDLAAAQAEVALRTEALINANGRVNRLRVRLLKLIHPIGLAAIDTELTPQSMPIVPEEGPDDLNAHLDLAMRMRPDLRQAGLLLDRGDLDLVLTRNGLLPRMDLFIRLGKTGYADSFGRSAENIDGDGYDIVGGLEFFMPVANRAAQARHRRAVLSQRQSVESLENIRDLIREDIKIAYIETLRTRQQVDATAATRKFQEEKLRAETAKFRVGKSTSLHVAQAQRDLVTSQVAEVEAITGFLIAMIELYRFEGSLLARRGISIFGSSAAMDRP